MQRARTPVPKHNCAEYEILQVQIVARYRKVFATCMMGGDMRMQGGYFCWRPLGSSDDGGGYYINFQSKMTGIRD